MQIRLKPLCILPLASLLAAGCMSTHERLNRYSGSLATGDYAGAEAMAVKSEKDKPADALMWQLHKGSAQQLQGRAEDAVKTFDTAEDGFIALDNASLLSQGANATVAMLSNDAKFPYDGGGQERIFCALYKGIGYASLGQMDAARTELNRAGDWQDSWISDRRRQITGEEERLRKEEASQFKASETARRDQLSGNITSSDSLNQLLGEKCGYEKGLAVSQEDILTSLSQQDWWNAYATHLRGVFRWLNGDNARGDLRASLAAAPQSALAAQDLAECDGGVKPQGMAWVYIEDGLCPIRDEIRIDLPLGLIPFQHHILYTGLALPRLRFRPEASPHYSIKTTKETREAECIQDVDRLVKTEFDLYFRGAVQREIVRLLIRTIPQIVLAELAEHDRDHAGLYFLSQIGVAAASAATLGADVRSWTALPKRVWCQRVAFEPGQELTVQCATRDIPVQMPDCGNAIVVLRYPAPGAVPSVSIIPFPKQQGTMP